MADEQLLNKYMESLQKLIVSRHFKPLLKKLKKHNKENTMLFNYNEHIILPELMKADFENQGEYFKKILIVCLGVGRIRGDYFYTTVAAHFMRPNANTDKLRFIAEPLNIAIREVPRHRNWKLDAVLRALHKRFDNIVLPTEIDFERLEDSVIKDLEVSSFGSELFDLYNNFIEFFTRLVPTLFTRYPVNDTSLVNVCPNYMEIPEETYNDDECCQVLRIHILRLLGYPLVYLHCHYEQFKLVMGRNGKTSPCRRLTKAGQVAEKLIELLDLVGNSTDYCLHWLENEDWTKEECDGPTSENLRWPGQDIDIKLNFEGVINYLYLVYCETLGQRNFVLSPKFVFSSCLKLINYMLSDTENYFEAMYKTLRLAQILGEDLRDDWNQLTSETLNTETFQIFLTSTITVIKDYKSLEIQNLGKKVLATILLAFNFRGRYYMLRQLFASPENFGIVGHLIESLEYFIFETHTQAEFGRTGQFVEMREYFRGKNLQLLFERVLSCLNWRDNLVNHIAHVISLLNLFRQLLVIDRRGNVSGVMNYMPKIINEFLEPLKSNLEEISNEFKTNFGSNQKLLSNWDLARVAILRIYECCTLQPVNYNDILFL